MSFYYNKKKYIDLSSNLKDEGDIFCLDSCVSNILFKKAIENKKEYVIGVLENYIIKDFKYIGIKVGKKKL